MKKRRGRFRIFGHIRSNPKQFLLGSKFMHWFGLGIFLLLFFLLLSSNFLRVSKVECIHEGGGECDPVLIAELQNHLGEHTFLVNILEIEEKIKKADPKYAGISVQAKLPNQLILFIGKKVAFANIKISSSSGSLLIDENYEVISILSQETSGVFTIIAPEEKEVGVGEKIQNQTTLKSIQIAKEMKKSYIYPRKMEIISPTEIIVEIFDGKNAIFSSTGDIPRQVTSLQLILSKATISPEPRGIDVRFDMPVLKY